MSLTKDDMDRAIRKATGINNPRASIINYHAIFIAGMRAAAERVNRQETVSASERLLVCSIRDDLCAAADELEKT